MIPKQYQWLYTIGLLPRTVTAFLSIYGTKEVLGAGNSPIIMNWAKVLKITVFINDAIAWCGLAMAWIAYQAGYGDYIPKSPLWARNWKSFGYKTDIPMLGDCLTFERGSGGHTGIYIAEDDVCYHVGGGNQSDNVTIARVEKKRLLSATIPPFKNAPAASRKRYFVDAKGAISKNEA